MRTPRIFNPSRSLASRITLRVIAVMLFFFVIVTLFIYRTTAKGIYHEANARYMGLLKGNNEQVNATLRAVEVAISNAVPLVQENLNSPERLYDVVERIVGLNPDIVGSAVAFEPNYYKDKGVWFSPYAYRSGDAIKSKQLGSADYEYHYMDWYQIPKLLGRAYWSEPYFDTDGGNMMMTTYSLPLYNSHGELYAIVTADIALEWLSRMMLETDSINRSLYREMQGKSSTDTLTRNYGYSFIIGRSGTYIAHPKKERMLNETYFSFCMETPDSTDEHVGYEMISGKRGSTHLDANGKISIFYAPIERTGWSMAIVIPDAVMLAEAQRVGLTIVGMMLLGLLAMFLVCRYAIRRVTKPLTRFAASADEIAQGNFNAPLPDVTTHDEMRRLYDSFDTMQQSLNHQISETIRVTEQKGRIESELNIARSIQMSMLPKTFPPNEECKNIAIYGLLTPAKAVGGDLYDFYIRDKKMFFCIGDVSGKGVPAALVMAFTRALFRSITTHESQPERIMSQLSNAISEENEANMFVTLFIGVLNMQTGHMQYCNAGHNAPLLISEDGSQIGLMPVDSNIPAGIMPGWNYSGQDIEIHNGTTIFLYTDGLTEAEDKDHGQFGEQRLIDNAQAAGSDGDLSPRTLIEKIADAVSTFVGDAEQSDDLTMMAIKLTMPPHAKTPPDMSGRR